MTFKDMVDRVSNGEVVPATFINGIPADQFISRNWNHFQNLTVENDLEKADCLWIYSKEAREKGKFNP